MSSEKFLEINSTYRDRTKFQNPSNFVVSPANNDTPINRISNAYPIYNFQSPTWELMNVDPTILVSPYWREFNILTHTGGQDTGSIISFPRSYGQLNLNGVGSSCRVMLDGVANINNNLTVAPFTDIDPLPTVFRPTENVTADGQHQSSTENDYYRGMSLQIFDEVTPVGRYVRQKPLCTSIITEYKGAYNQDKTNFRRGGYYYCDLDCPLLSLPVDEITGYVWTIGYGGATDQRNNPVLGYTSLHINGGSTVNNKYKNYYIEDIDLNIRITSPNTGPTTNSKGIDRRMKQISSYDGTTCRATLAVDSVGIAGFTDASGAGFGSEGTGNPVSAVPTAFNGDRFRIRIEKPLVMGWGCMEPSVGARPSHSDVGVPPTPPWSDFFLNSGIGRLNCKFGVYEFNVTSGGTLFNEFIGKALFSEQVKPLIQTNAFIVANPESALSSQRIAIIATHVDTNGELIKGKIAYPGFFIASPIGHSFEIHSPGVGGLSAIVKVTTTRSVIDLNPAYFSGSRVSGLLETKYGFYDNKLLYLSDKI